MDFGLTAYRMKGLLSGRKTYRTETHLTPRITKNGD